MAEVTPLLFFHIEIPVLRMTGDFPGIKNYEIDIYK